MIFDTHANILSDVVKRRLEGKSGIIESHHIPELLEGNVTGGIWTYCMNVEQPLHEDINQAIAYILEELEESTNIQIVTSKDDWAEEDLNVILGFQGLSLIKDLKHLEEIYHLGFRHASLTLNEKNHFATGRGCLEATGLTEAGFELIKKMNELGMVIDVSGANRQTMMDILKTTEKPIIASNANCYSLVPTANNLTDEQIKDIAEVDGIIGVTALAKSLHSPMATVEELVNQIDYLKQLVGVRHISLGLNFRNYFENEMLNLVDCENASQASAIIDELMNRNYSSVEIDAIAAINAKRVINKILKD